tara:strand:- start:37713 stop:38267 length:555 start_codon:yes stop_codon:yes gene_type:complete
MNKNAETKSMHDADATALSEATALELRSRSDLLALDDDGYARWDAETMLTSDEDWVLPQNAPRPLIMVAEDDSDLRELVCEQLIRDGYEVVAVESGSEAIEHFDRAIRHLSDFRMPSLLITDLRMPGFDGLEVITYACFVPSILITAFPSESLCETAHKRGVNYVMEKPFNPRDLKAAVATLLA